MECNFWRRIGRLQTRASWFSSPRSPSARQRNASTRMLPAAPVHSTSPTPIIAYSAALCVCASSRWSRGAFRLCRGASSRA
eukprot:8320602-Pyramimonas_sp.AAC.1